MCGCLTAWLCWEVGLKTCLQMKFLICTDPTVLVLFLAVALSYLQACGFPWEGQRGLVSIDQFYNSCKTVCTKYHRGQEFRERVRPVVLITQNPQVVLCQMALWDMPAGCCQAGVHLSANQLQVTYVRREVLRPVPQLLFAEFFMLSQSLQFQHLTDKTLDQLNYFSD